ncbi:MAG: mandelate racemase/muconate lactonizing enzyme family protein [Fuerstiella sp.]|nr:mandelate racemase/muconate lactonizing enzyme family protein [Fuerstiella sp.]
MTKTRQSRILSRRNLLATGATAAIAGSWWSPVATAWERHRDHSSLRITGLELFPVRLPRNRTWLFIRLRTNQGISGIAEATLGGTDKVSELKTFFQLIDGRSPFDIRRYRKQGLNLAVTGGRKMAGAFSAIEQALWDLVGKTLNVPVYDLFGGKVRDEIDLYANINNATTDRSPAGFAKNADRAVREGFPAIKAAPFDGFPSLDAPSDQVKRATDTGVDCIRAIRAAAGDEVKIHVDFHSYFDVGLTIDIAERVEPCDLSWIEEPIDPRKVIENNEIKKAIPQRLAGGEFLVGLHEFGPLCRTQCMEVLMPDVQICGGLLEGQRISTAAELHGMSVAPHNAHGPVATVASAQLSAVLPNFEILEYQWNEVPWRAELIDPPESIHEGRLYLNDRPGFGVELNDQVIAAHL